MPLTGRFWFRKTWTGKLVLLVKEKRPKWFAKRGSFTLRWRNAKLIDFAERALQPLLSLEHSMRPDQFAPRTNGLRVVPAAKPEAPAPIVAKAA